MSILTNKMYSIIINLFSFYFSNQTHIRLILTPLSGEKEKTPLSTFPLSRFSPNFSFLFCVLIHHFLSYPCIRNSSLRNSSKMWFYQHMNGGKNLFMVLALMDLRSFSMAPKVLQFPPRYTYYSCFQQNFVALDCIGYCSCGKGYVQYENHFNMYAKKIYSSVRTIFLFIYLFHKVIVFFLLESCILS